MKNPGISNGLYLGAILCVTSFIMYFVSPRFYLSYASWFNFLFYILFMVKAGKEEKELLEGYASFGEMLKPTFICFALGSLIVTLFYYVLLNFIDPSLIDLTKDLTIEGIEQAGAFIGEDMLEEMKDAILDDPDIVSLGKSLMGWLFTLILGLIVALIISAILKNEKIDNLDIS